MSSVLDLPLNDVTTLDETSVATTNRLLRKSARPQRPEHRKAKQGNYIPSVSSKHEDNESLYDEATGPHRFNGKHCRYPADDPVLDAVILRVDAAGQAAMNAVVANLRECRAADCDVRFDPHNGKVGANRAYCSEACCRREHYHRANKTKVHGQVLMTLMMQ